MTVRDLLKMEMDIDVYDDVCEEIAIAFCGPMELTEEGEKEFSEVMDYEIEILPAPAGYGCGCVIVKCDDPDEKVCERKLRKGREFFESIAGYCPADDYDKWFKEVE